MVGEGVGAFLLFFLPFVLMALPSALVSFVLLFIPYEGRRRPRWLAFLLRSAAGSFLMLFLSGYIPAMTPVDYWLPLSLLAGSLFGGVWIGSALLARMPREKEPRWLSLRRR